MHVVAIVSSRTESTKLSALQQSRQRGGNNTSQNLKVKEELSKVGQQRAGGKGLQGSKEGAGARRGVKAASADHPLLCVADLAFLTRWCSVVVPKSSNGKSHFDWVMGKTGDRKSSV